MGQAVPQLPILYDTSRLASSGDLGLVPSGLVTTARTSSSSELLWALLAGAWSVIFATPHFYWALGGRAGLGAQTAAADAALQQGWFAAYNLTAGCLGLLGAAMALVLANRWVGQRMHRWLMIASMAACAGLLLRGILGLTLLGVSLFRGTLDRETPALLLAIEPWFVLGGLAYAGMALSQRRGSDTGTMWHRVTGENRRADAEHDRTPDRDDRAGRPGDHRRARSGDRRAASDEQADRQGADEPGRLTSPV